MDIMNEYNEEIEWDLSILENSVCQCIETNDLDQGLNLARNGYEIAIEAGIEKWMEIFENLINNIKLKQQTLIVEKNNDLIKINEQETMQFENNHITGINLPESKTIANVKRKSSDLKALDGIRSKTIEILKENNIQSIEELASTDINTLKKIKGIGEKTAERYINTAISYSNQIPLSRYNKASPFIDLKNEKSSSELQEGNLQEFEEEIIDLPQNNEFKDTNNHLDAIIKIIDIEEVESSIPHDFKKSEKEPNLIHEKKLNDEKKDEINKIPLKKDILNVQESLKKKEKISQIEKPSSTLQAERLTQEKVQELIISIEKDLRTLDYWILKKDQGRYNSLLKNVDIMAIRSFEISDFLELIILIPISISYGMGKHRIYEEEIRYTSANPKKTLKANDKRLLIDNVIEGLLDVRDQIFQNIMEEGILFRFLEKYMKNNLKIERSITRKELFLTSGQKYHEVIICPVLGVNNTVEFLESSMAPFAWQRNVNLYTIDIKNIKELINYIEKKHVLIETHAVKKNLIDDYIDTNDKFFSRMKYFALPFMIFTGLLLLILTIAPHILAVFIGIGIGITILFGIGSLFLIISLLKAQNTLHDYYMTPYFQRPLNIDDTGIILIKEELPEEWMHQFIYEGDMNTQQLDEVRSIEMKAYKNHIANTQQFKEFEDKNEKEIIENEIMENLRFRPSIAQKYNKFLED